MANIRRVMIGIVGLLLVLDAGALAYIKFTSGPAPSLEKSKLVLWVDDAGQAKAIAASFKEAGYEPIVKPDKRKDTVEADYRLAMKSTKKKLLEPLAEILKKAGHKQLSYSEDGTVLYLGGYHKQKAAAQRIADRIEANDKMVFEVVAGTKTVMKPSNRVILMEIPSNQVEVLVSGLDNSYTIADQEETPLDEPEAEPEAE